MTTRTSAAIALGAALLAIGCKEQSATGESRKAPDAAVASAPHTADVRTVRVAPGLLDSGRIRTARVGRRDAAGAVRLNADVIASPEGAAEAGTLLAGRIARFEAREGDRVKRGQVLAWLDSPEAARSVADLIRARTRTETQARKVTRLEGLVASEAATAAAIDEARLDLDLARADLAGARTLVGSLGLGEPPPTGTGATMLTTQLPIRSPVDGVVVERTAPLGAHVSPETHLFRLVSEGRVLVEARIPDGANVVLAPASTARVQPRSGAACTARVLGVLPQVDAPTRSRRARLAPEPGCTSLVPGAQAGGEVEVPAPSVDGGVDQLLTVPTVAIVELKTAMILFVRGNEPGTFEMRPVEAGLRLGDQIAVHAGVAEGEEVVVEGTVLLKGELMRAELGGED